MSHSHAEPMPRAALLFGACAIITAMTAAGIGRLTGAADSTPTAKPVISRELLFNDQPNGSVAVFDAANPSRPIETFAPETNGFLRATMRGLAQQRLRQEASRTTPFRLTGYADGRLTLLDPATGRSVEMEAFGHSNEEVFAHLLTAPAAAKGVGS